MLNTGIHFPCAYYIAQDLYAWPYFQQNSDKTIGCWRLGVQWLCSFINSIDEATRLVFYFMPTIETKHTFLKHHKRLDGELIEMHSRIGQLHGIVVSSSSVPRKVFIDIL